MEQSLSSLEKRVYNDIQGKNTNMDDTIARVKKQTEEATKENRSLLG